MSCLWVNQNVHRDYLMYKYITRVSPHSNVELKRPIASTSETSLVPRPSLLYTWVYLMYLRSLKDHLYSTTMQLQSGHAVLPSPAVRICSSIGWSTQLQFVHTHHLPDLPRTFDSVLHHRLHLKLDHIGIHGSLLKWIHVSVSLR